MTLIYEVRHESKTSASKDASRPWQLFVKLANGADKAVIGRYKTESSANKARAKRAKR